MTREELQAAEAKINRGKEILAELDILGGFSNVNLSSGITTTWAQFAGDRGRANERLVKLIETGIATRIVELEWELERLTVESKPVVAHPVCRGCNRPLEAANSWMYDGCPCNSACGVNDEIPCLKCGKPYSKGRCDCASGETTRGNVVNLCQSMAGEAFLTATLAESHAEAAT